MHPHRQGDAPSLPRGCTFIARGICLSHEHGMVSPCTCVAYPMRMGQSAHAHGTISPRAWNKQSPKARSAHPHGQAEVAPRERSLPVNYSSPVKAAWQLSPDCYKKEISNRNRTTSKTATRSPLNSRAVRSTPGEEACTAPTLKESPRCVRRGWSSRVLSALAFVRGSSTPPGY